MTRLLWLWLYSIACACCLLAEWARDYAADKVKDEGVDDDEETG